MAGIKQHAALAAVGLAAGALLAQAALHTSRAQPRPPVTATPDVPPAGWTEVCDSAAIGFVCHTYPPGDDNWQPKAPVPPEPPLPTPWPGGEDAR